MFMCPSCCSARCGRITVQVNGCNSLPVAGAPVTLSYKELSGIAVGSGGSGYTAAPGVTLSGGGGSGGSAVATVSGGVVTGIAIVTPGKYTSAPTVTLSGGGGSGATATATLSAAITVDTIATNLGIASFTFGTHGSGYTSIPTVNISGGGGTGAAATANLSAVAVTGVTLSTGGSGYTAAPLVTILGGGGTGASASSRLTAGPVTSIRLTAGSSYTTGTGYAVGFTGGGFTMAATGTFDVDSAGRVTNLVLTSGGSGYTSAPTLDFAGVGGSGATAFATISGGVVTSINLESGSGYTPGTGYALGVSGGSGTGAAGTFDVDAGGKVTNLVLTSGGSGYTTVPTMTFPGAGGSGATATVRLGPTSVGALVLGLGGSGYTSTPLLTIGAPASGTTATGTATIPSQTVASLTIADPGRDYTSAPTVTIGPPASGTTATATAVLASAASVFFPPGVGIYTASATPPAGPAWWGTTPVTGTVTLPSCSSSPSLSLTLAPATGYACACNLCRDALPNTCTITDANGTHTATRTGASWRVCYTYSRALVSTADCTTSAGTGSVALGYSLNCPTVANQGFKITQYWSGCDATHAVAGDCSGPSTSAAVEPVGGGFGLTQQTLQVTADAGSGTNPNDCNGSQSFTISGGLLNGTVAVSFP